MQRQFWCFGHISAPFGCCHGGRKAQSGCTQLRRAILGAPGRKKESKLLWKTIISLCSLTWLQSKTVLSPQYTGRYSPEQNTMGCFPVWLLPLCVTPQIILPFCEEFNLFPHMHVDRVEEQRGFICHEELLPFLKGKSSSWPGWQVRQSVPAGCQPTRGVTNTHSTHT